MHMRALYLFMLGLLNKLYRLFMMMRFENDNRNGFCTASFFKREPMAPYFVDSGWGRFRKAFHTVFHTFNQSPQALVSSGGSMNVCRSEELIEITGRLFIQERLS